MEKVSLSGGKFVTPSITFGRGARNKVLNYQGERTYDEAVNHARNDTYVNFYDVGDHRAWLIDGASAVLHLTLTQLTHPRSPYQIGKLCDNEGFNIQKFKFPPSDCGPESAAEALRDESNKKLVISIDPPKISTHTTRKTTSKGIETETETKEISEKYLFWQQVKLNLSIFELMYDYQKEQVSVIRGTTRERLEGWDFFELVKGQSSQKPKFTYLKKSGWGWVDLLREIYTINLLGAGFGALLEPTNTATELCKGWKEVPRGRDYMAMSTSMLKEIFINFGKIDKDSLQIARDIYLHQSGHVYEKCKCSSGMSTCNRSQMVLPHLSTRKKNPKLIFSQENGALIFGKRGKSGWSYPPTGPPKFSATDDESETGLSGPLEHLRPQNATLSDSGYGTITSTSSPNPHAVSQPIVSPSESSMPFSEAGPSGSELRDSNSQEIVSVHEDPSMVIEHAPSDPKSHASSAQGTVSSPKDLPTFPKRATSNSGSHGSMQKKGLWAKIKLIGNKSRKSIVRHLSLARSR